MESVDGAEVEEVLRPAFPPIKKEKLADGTEVPGSTGEKARIRIQIGANFRIRIQMAGFLILAQLFTSPLVFPEDLYKKINLFFCPVAAVSCY